MKRVYVSYNRRDQAEALRIRDDLRAAGMEVMIDVDWAGGKSFIDSMRENLTRTDALLVLVSTDTLNSYWVPLEIFGAYSLHKTIIPVALEPIVYSSLPPNTVWELVIKPLTFVEVHANYPADVQRLIDHIQTLKPQKQQGINLLSWQYLIMLIAAFGIPLILFAILNLIELNVFSLLAVVVISIIAFVIMGLVSAEEGIRSLVQTVTGGKPQSNA